METNIPVQSAQISLKSIQAPIEKDLGVFRIHFKEAMKAKSWLLTQVTQYILKQKGKQIRPMLVLLSAKLCGVINESSYRAASLVELLHTATLIHDDVVDEADQRRGVWSINAIWRNKVGVLLGDYLLSRGLLLALDHRDYTQLHLLSDAVRRMSEGELLQIEKTRHLDIDEATYFQIISDKTASLIAACMAIGASSTTTDETIIQKLKTIGEKLGLAFQIRDDLFDYGVDDVGKPIGIDLQEKKMTLPLIYALTCGSTTEKKSILKIVRKKRKTTEDLKTVTTFVDVRGGLTYARQKMYELIEDVRALLATFPASEAKNALLDLATYTITRRK